MSIQIGIQLFSIDKKFAEDPLGSLRRVLEIGFHHIEPAHGKAETDPGIGCGISKDDLLAFFEPYGAYIGSTHISPITDETLPHIVDYHQAVGNKNIVVPIQFYTGYDHIMRRCEDYNRFGKYLVERGMNPLSYHNHYHEFQIIQGKPILYHILDNTDPAYVNIEMDTGWVQRAGRNPVTEMRHVGKRLRLIHVKDFAHNPPNLLVGKKEMISWDNFGANHQKGDVMKPEDFVEIGRGMMPVQEILNVADDLGAEAAILEQDDTAGDIFESLAGSMEGLKKLKNIKI